MTGDLMSTMWSAVLSDIGEDEGYCIDNSAAVAKIRLAIAALKINALTCLVFLSLKCTFSLTAEIDLTLHFVAV